ncbi:rhomboid family intramembrane serine protease [Erysipelotrichaceae bacterium OttesenSCG-928-M19]|nr:rhomboid family intramembrane serine protease [Erysipelotrichaceae bacterium OttesenSCG-928-M19]
MRNNNKFTILIIIYVVIYFAIDLFGRQYGLTSYDLLGVQKNLVLDYHQYYRVLTYSFAHGDIMHLAVNMIALYSLAEPVIKFTDEKFSVIIYFAAALVSGLGIVFFSNAIAVGSSGAIYGLFGVLIYFALKQAKYGYNQLIVNMLPIIIINLVISFMPGISLMGHLFGLITGLIGSYIYDKKFRYR